MRSATCSAGGPAQFLSTNECWLLPMHKNKDWLALGDDFRTLPIGQIVADIPQFDAFGV